MPTLRAEGAARAPADIGAHLAACLVRGGQLDDGLWLLIDDLNEPAPPAVEDGRALDPAERARLARLPPGPARLRLLRGRGLLRWTVGPLLGLPPERLRLEIAPGGRPRLIGPGPSFNLSHSGRWLGLAVAFAGPGGRAAAVGLDVEAGPTGGRGLAPVVSSPVVSSPVVSSPLLSSPHLEPSVMERVFTEAERAVIAEDAEPAGAAQRLWTRKEAALKATGAGLRLPARALDFSGPAPIWGPGLAALDGDWRRYERPLPDGGWCCVCTRGAAL